MKAIHVAALALNAALYVAVGILFYSVMPVRFEGVRFWPPVVVPAVFAVFFGPWVGGIGAAIGIFFSDIILGNDPLLSLMAGITSNFTMFFLIGYLSRKKTGWIAPTLIYGIITVFLAWIAYVYAGIFWVGVVVGSYVVFLVLALLKLKWQNYEFASVTGLLVGSAIIGAMVPLYAYLFTQVGQTPIASFTLAGGLALFIFTFATEIPFLLILGPPIIEAVYRAFPNLSNQKMLEEHKSEKNR
ncbi:MAG: hypothetical protein ACM3WQ_01380 [Chloroflexota bacterium]|nr:hypothetical protein [Candidatus Sulfotelmatobacter sp.]